MRPSALTIAAMSACVVLAGCATTVDDRRCCTSTGRQPSPSRRAGSGAADRRRADRVLGTAGLMGQLVEGGSDMLLAGVGESDASPAECVSPAYRLEKVVYQASPVRSVASQTWAGGFRRPTRVGLLRRRPIRDPRRREGLLRRFGRQVARVQRSDPGAASTRTWRARIEPDHRRESRGDGVGDRDPRRGFDDSARSRRRGGLRCGRRNYGCRRRRRGQGRRRGGQPDSAEDRHFLTLARNCGDAICPASVTIAR